MRAQLIAALALGLVACGESEQRQVIDLPDGAVMDSGGSTLDSALRPDEGLLMDAAPVIDAAPVDDATPVIDAMPVNDALIDEGLAPDLNVEPDGGPLPGHVPEFEQAGVAKVERITHVAWIDGAGAVRARMLGEDGAWGGPSRVLNPGPADALAAYTVNGVPWIAWSHEGGPIGLTQADIEDSFEYTLDLRGPPLLAQADDRNLLVMGTDASGRLGWQRLDPDLPQAAQPAPIYDETSLPRPDSLVGVVGGALMRFSLSGQCVQLNNEALPIGNLPCRLVEGRLVSNRSLPVLAHALIQDGIERLAVSPVFNDSTAFQVLAIENQNLKRFSNDGSARVIVGRSIRNDETQGLMQMAFIGPEHLAYSEASPNWRFPDARAAAQQDTSAYIFSFGTADDPKVDVLTLREQVFEDEPYAFNPLGCTAPSAERCDDVDHDCDGRNKDGYCCVNDAVGFDAEIQFPEGAELSEVRIGEYNNNHIRVMATKIAETSWVAWILKDYVLEDGSTDFDVVRLGQCVNGESLGCPAGSNVRCDHRENVNEYHCNADSGTYELPPFEINDMDHAIEFIGIDGAFFAMVGIDTAGESAIWWHYYRTVPAITRKEIIPCDEVLAADHLDFAGLEQASLLVVCRDKVMRMYVSEDFEDVEYRFDTLGHGPVEWARLTRSSAASLALLVGYHGSDGPMRLQRYSFVAGAQALLSERISTQLASLSPEELEVPIQLHPLSIGPPIQIHDGHARLLVSREDNNETVWLDVVTHNRADQVHYNATAELLVTAAPLEGGGFDFWMINIPSRRQDLNLWSARPTLTVEEGALWALAPADYYDPIMVLTPGDNNRWRIRTYGFSCQAP
ncbi:hypothetical protein KKF91_06995 [Myxococcota bacterium]|nr:hypothetical protein [Myxococcota bacterium]MBU1430302.1 hypothetical protein [Myxococcota bacterium]MBU1896266.1 hypothetical protein [Myxococcota bacterium]